MRIIIGVILTVIAVWSADKALNGIDGKERWVRFAWISLYAAITSATSHFLFD